MQKVIRTIFLVLSLFVVTLPSYAATDETATVPEDSVAGAALEGASDTADTNDAAAQFPIIVTAVVIVVVVVVVSAGTILSLRGRAKKRRE